MAAVTLPPPPGFVWVAEPGIDPSLPATLTAVLPSDAKFSPLGNIFPDYSSLSALTPAGSVSAWCGLIQR